MKRFEVIQKRYNDLQEKFNTKHEKMKKFEKQLYCSTLGNATPLHINPNPSFD